MSLGIKVVKGMKDILPEEIPAWYFVEQQLKSLALAYGYQEIRMPLLEQTELFKRAIGEVTDIVEKEMYTFEDKGGEWLTLRPESTAQSVRLVIENSLIRNQSQRLWYMGPMFRRENPQKGRYRQFYQFGIEAFGLEGPDVDVEQIAMMARLWRLLGLQDKIVLKLNSLGTLQERKTYRQALIAFYESCPKLDEDSTRRLHSNPMRILDSKNPMMIEINQQ
ncbi:MAG: histidine--tRNA ligase, partial [Candidatus Berkiella sp.]